MLVGITSICSNQIHQFFALLFLFNLFLLQFHMSSAVSKSWINYDPESHFPIQNLPYGVFSQSTNPRKRIGVAIGEQIVDLACLHDAGLLNDLGFDSSVLAEETMNSFMELPRKQWQSTRRRLIELLELDGSDARLRSNELLKKKALVPLREAKMHLQAKVGDYTDFYSSREHATNVGIMIRGKDNALQPNWLHLPVGYHGRSSTVVISGTDVVRPHGQLQADASDPSKGSVYAACRLLDFELELAFFLGGPDNPIGTDVKLEEADDRMFGVVIMNDWSARDLQTWEYVPLVSFSFQILTDFLRIS